MGGYGMRFSDEFLTELRSHIDIEELIGKYTDIRHRGTRTPVALCPFHTEKTPSFVIYRDTQSYYCFGCGAGGDAITFIKNIERLDFTEAVKYLCEKAGMNMPTDEADDARISMRRRCYEANREAARFYHSCLSLPEAAAANEYIKKRRLSPETVTRFGLGYAPDRWDALLKHLKKKGFNEDELVSFDLARKTKNGGTIDAFRNRLIFPIIDLRGNVTAFGGRVLDDSKPKYLNSSDTPVYRKGQGIYALNFAKNNSGRQLILCEGYMDVIAMHQAGFTNAVAGLGTAFTGEQINLLSRYCDELFLSFDSDEAGRKATERALRLLKNAPIKIKVLDYTGEGKDPDEVIKEHGRERMQKVISRADNDTEFALKRAREKYDLSTDDGRLGYLNDAVEILADVGNAMERDIYTSRLASELSVSTDSVKTQTEKARKRERRRESTAEFENAAKAAAGEDSKIRNPDRKKYLRAAKAEEFLLAALIKNPDYLKKLASRLSADLFVTPYNRRFFEDISARIKSGRSLDISAFGNNAENDDISYISYLFTLGKFTDENPQGCEQCIQTLIAEKEKMSRPQTARGLSDDDWLKAMEAKRKKQQ